MEDIKNAEDQNNPNNPNDFPNPDPIPNPAPVPDPPAQSPLKPRFTDYRPPVDAPTSGMSPPPLAEPVAPVAALPKKKTGIALPGIALLVVGLAGGFFLNVALGSPLSDKTDTTTHDQMATPSKVELKVPEGATVIAECAKGRGKQYVLPKDIPFGPIYNVYNDKVIGLEFMPGKEDFLLAKDYIDLKLEGVEYNHMNIGLLSQGHSGYPEPHYHIDVFTISNEDASKITCE